MSNNQEIINSISELKIKYFIQQAKLLQSLFKESEINSIYYKMINIDCGSLYEITSLKNEYGMIDIEEFTQELDDNDKKNCAFQAKFKEQSIKLAIEIFDMLSSDFLCMFDGGDMGEEFGLLNLESIEEKLKELQND